MIGVAKPWLAALTRSRGRSCRRAGSPCRPDRIRAQDRDVLHGLRRSQTALNRKCVEMQTKNLAAAFTGFSKLGRDERLKALLDMGALEADDIAYLRSGGLKDMSFADSFIENAIGYLEMPLGIASNFRIDGRDYAIPMAVEETSIIAAASKTARWVRDCGSIATEVRGAHIIGQIQCANVGNWARFQSGLSGTEGHLIALANQEPAASLVRRGGGSTISRSGPSSVPTAARWVSFTSCSIRAMRWAPISSTRYANSCGPISKSAPVKASRCAFCRTWSTPSSRLPKCD